MWTFTQHEFCSCVKTQLTGFTCPSHRSYSCWKGDCVTPQENDGHYNRLPYWFCGTHFAYVSESAEGNRLMFSFFRIPWPPKSQDSSSCHKLSTTLIHMAISNNQGPQLLYNKVQNSFTVKLKFRWPNEPHRTALRGRYAGPWIEGSMSHIQSA